MQARSNGTLSFNADGSFAYTPNTGFIGTDSFTYLANDSKVNSDPATVNITVNPPAIMPTLPVVGFTASPVVSEPDGPGLLLIFNAQGIIPEEGLVVSVGGDFRTSAVEQGLQFRQVVESEGVEYLRFNRDTQAYEFRLTQANATVTIPVFDDIVEEADTTYTYQLLASEAYTVDSAAATAEVTYVDGVPGGIGPVVSISTEQTLLYEGDTLTVNFSVDGEIPADGLTLYVLSPTRGALGEFVIFNEDGTPAVTWEGIAGFPERDGTGGGFFVTLTEPTASLSLQVFDDGPNEGIENITFNLVDGELYEVNPDASGVTLTISDVPTNPVGDTGDNILVGTTGNDSLFANAGNDRIFGGLGNDYLFGGAGDDYLDGGDGNDALFGGDGNDTLLGGAGNDYLTGGAGDNLLDGGDGNDILYAGAGNNTLLGGAGDDIIYSGSGQNLINGGLGNDLIFLNGGQDTVVVAQGAGVDTINNFQVSLGQKVGLSGGLSFDQLTLTQSGMDTLIQIGDETLAVLKFVQSSSLTIVDIADENSQIKPIVTFSTEPKLLIESQETVSLLNFNLSEPPPTLGTTVTVSTPNLSEFNLSLIQTQGGEINLNNETRSLLETALSEKVTPQVPGATIAITSPLGNWSEAAGVATIEDNTPLESDDRFQIGSVTKTFTATTILKLVEAGKLTLEDTLTDWLSQEVTANIPDSDKITIRQLLNHSSGIAEYNGILLQQAVTNPNIFLRNWQPEEIINLINNVEQFFAPGESWQYSNTNYILAGMVIEAATGNNIAAEMRSQIFEPLQLENTFFAEEEEIPGGYVKGYLDFNFDGILDDVSIANPSWTWTSGAIVSNTQDLTQFARALYAGELLSKESLAQMFTLVDTGRGFSYGLGMMSFETPDLGVVVGHRGGTLGFNANMWYSSEDDFTYVDLANGRSNEELVVDIIPAFTQGVIPTVGNTSNYSEFNFTITEQNAQISLPVLNDGEIEGEETATFTVEAGEGYEVDSNANSGTFTIVDSLIEPTSEPIFGTIGEDVIEVSGSGGLIFGGDESDVIDASISSSGSNRIYGGRGDDTFILGSGDRLIGGAGDDKFFALSGGDNIITGGAGADQFWIATAEIPDSANIITDFTLGEDVLGIAGLGIGFGNLSITQQEENSLIALNGSDLAILQGIGAASLSAENFTFV
ncbi:serine hydrolase [Nostoc sp. UHCC 0870]|uniref:serine hydrolase n=1 Tax=Nostoc sp. UHCC 0870 TaxID=2914041 RepID=UPI001EE07053|nr:serine hydrolase [Nostoc sp. UHCC 0870]UKP00018.1 serine hydrolase [Nostoc sp. UHCC 0870]